MYKSQRYSLISFILIFLIFVFISVIVGRYPLRIDASSGKHNSISTVSRRIASDISDYLRIDFYISPKLKNLSPVPQDIIDLLQEYVQFSKGRIELHIIDPSSSEVAREAQNSGVQPQQIQIVEDNQSSIATVYSGLVLSYGDEIFTFPTVFNADIIEYQISSALRRLVLNNVPRIAVLFGTDGLSLEGTHRLFHEHLIRDYNLFELERGQQIPPDTSSVFLIGAADLDTDSIRYLDEYLVNGGKIIAAVSPVEIDLDAGMHPVPLGDSIALEWLSHHGAMLEQNLVLDQRNLRIPVEHSSGGIQYQLYQDYPHWIDISSANVNPDHILTADFIGLDLFWPGLLRLVPGPFRNTEVLMHASRNSWIVGYPFYINPDEADSSINTAVERDGNYIVAGEISGSFLSFFGSNQHIMENPVDKGGRLLVIADSDFTSDLIQFAESWHNTQFISMIADWITNDSDLMEIRSRSQRTFRLNLIQDEKLFQARARFVTMLHTVLIPISIAVAGFLFLLYRRKKFTGDFL
ncbi:Gldg family protein [Spirochaeta dissipatitropha]